MINSMTFLGGHVPDLGVVIPVDFVPEAGPRFDIWAFPASLVVSVFTT